MQNSKSTIRYIEDMLESDDELPTTYEETPDIPAYKLDSRFEPIKFTWIDSNFSKYYQKNQLEDKPKLSELYSSLNKDFLSKTQNLKPGEKCLVLNGVLSEQDLYCLKCIEANANDSFLLWFVNFLMFKDLQSNFSFLKSCLVSTTPVPSLSDKINLENSDIKNFNFKFLVDSR